IPADIEAVVQVVQYIDQTDGVDVEHGGRVEVRSHARRIAGDADQVAHTGGVPAQKLGLDAQNIAVTAAEVVDSLDAGFALDELAGDLRAHAGAGARPVRHVDAVDAVRLAERRPGDLLRGVHSARRQDLDEGDE